MNLLSKTSWISSSKIPKYGWNGQGRWKRKLMITCLKVNNYWSNSKSGKQSTRTLMFPNQIANNCKEFKLSTPKRVLAGTKRKEIPQKTITLQVSNPQNLSLQILIKLLLRWKLIQISKMRKKKMNNRIKIKKKKQMICQKKKDRKMAKLSGICSGLMEGFQKSGNKTSTWMMMNKSWKKMRMSPKIQFWVPLSRKEGNLKETLKLSLFKWRVSRGVAI